MPMDRSKYPADWKAISLTIRERAEQRCECTGQCGDEHSDGRCNAPNHTIVVRSERRPAVWWEHSGCSNCLTGDPTCRPVEIVLTVAHHPDPTPTNCDPSNLLALCQRCHNKVDAPMRARNARATRHGRRAAGELPGLTTKGGT